MTEKELCACFGLGSGIVFIFHNDIGHVEITTQGIINCKLAGEKLKFNSDCLFEDGDETVLSLGKHNFKINFFRTFKKEA